MSDSVRYSVGQQPIIPMNKTIDALIYYLTSRECCYDFDKEKAVLHAGLEGENAKWRYLACQDDAGRFVMVSLLPLKAPEARRAACAELLVRINAKIGFGHFDLDFSDGELAFRTVVPIAAKSRLMVGVIEHVIRGHHILVDQFLPAISALLFAGVTPEKALKVKAQPTMPQMPTGRFSLN